MKRLLAVSAVTLFLAGVATAKSYWFSITATMKVGATGKLRAGDHEVKVSGNKATFSDGSKTVTVDAKVLQNDKKSADTIVETVGDRIHAINLGDSTTRLEFAE